MNGVDPAYGAGDMSADRTPGDLGIQPMISDAAVKKLHDARDELGTREYRNRIIHKQVLFRWMLVPLTLLLSGGACWLILWWLGAVSDEFSSTYSYLLLREGAYYPWVAVLALLVIVPLILILAMFRYISESDAKKTTSDSENPGREEQLVLPPGWVALVVKGLSRLTQSGTNNQ